MGWVIHHFGTRDGGVWLKYILSPCCSPQGLQGHPLVSLCQIQVPRLLGRSCWAPLPTGPASGSTLSVERCGNTHTHTHTHTHSREHALEHTHLHAHEGSLHKGKTHPHTHKHARCTHMHTHTPTHSLLAPPPRHYQTLPCRCWQTACQKLGRP